jgi:hypothetical protein
VSEASKTYTAREILLELFPGTDARLIPKPEPYRLERTGEGALAVVRDGAELIVFSPVMSAGNATTQLCCDLCKRSAPRHYLQMFRAELPGSKGRRYRYVSLCKDVRGCEARRSGDAPVEALLSRVLGR